MKVSIIIPIVRLKNLYPLLAMIRNNVGVPEGEYEILSAHDYRHAGCPEMVARLTKEARHDWVMFLGDDTEPQPNFLKNAIAAAEELPGWGLVALNDGIHEGKLATHWLAHKKLAEHNDGYFFHPDYHHLCCDRELTDIAQSLGVYAYAPDAVIKHRNPVVDKTAQDDEHYERAYSKADEDYQTYCRRKRARKGQTVGLAFPVTNEVVPSLFWQSMMYMRIPKGSEILLPRFGFHPGDIAKVRSDMVTAAIDAGCTHILFMDTDQTYYDDDLIDRLMSHDKPIVGGKVHRRWPPYDPLLRRGDDQVPDEEIDKGGLVEVDSTGTGCLLIDINVFLDIGKPYFETVRDDAGNVTAGEDVNFCRMAKKAGYEIHVDCDVKIGHLTTVEVGQGLYEIFKKIRGAKNGRK